MSEMALRPAASPAVGDDELQRELIEFDSEAAEGDAFRALAPVAPGGLSRFVEIKWPDGLAPTPGRKPRGESLPRADVLIVTWTVDEGHALSRVLTAGFDSRDDWKPYRKNFDTIGQLMVPQAPARQYGRLGTYWTTQIATRKVTLFKSDSHMSQDGPQLANAVVWKQIIEDVKPKWVITTGTGGGIGTEVEVGDVIVSRFVTFDCQRGFKEHNGDSYASPTDAPSARFEQATQLFRFNAQFLPKDNSRPPKILTASEPTNGVITTDFFGFDTSDGHYGLQGKADLSEMGDAVLGMVCKQLGAKAPAYSVVRNVSDPQIASNGMPIQQQAQMAADIYKAYGLWSTVSSAIVCWAIVAALGP
jgi:Phosphorylase superfamily